MNKPDNRKTVRIAPERWRKLKAEAAEQGKTIGDFIWMLYEEWVDLKDRKFGRRTGER